jgi:hypothetical protein
MFKVYANPIQRHEELASAFRAHMTQGQNMREANSYRKEFFDAVIKSADDVRHQHLRSHKILIVLPDCV